MVKKVGSTIIISLDDVLLKIVLKTHLCACNFLFQMIYGHNSCCFSLFSETAGKPDQSMSIKFSGPGIDWPFSFLHYVTVIFQT